MTTPRQYDELVMEAAKSLPVIAKALTDANTLKCVGALYNNGEVDEMQMMQVLYGILARQDGPEKEVEKSEPKVRYSELYRQKRQAGMR